MTKRLEQSLHELIESQVARTPDAVALQFGEQTFTYTEMNALTNQYARYLRDLGAGPDKLVAVVMERANEMIVALLSVLKSGAAYLPLDPRDPVDRMRLILDDADVSIVLTQSAHAPLLESFDGTVFSLDGGAPFLDAYGYADTSLENVTTPEHLAYVIYTSGSTGVPKGCMISHLAICNRLLWMRDHYGINAEDRVLQKTPFTFDVSVWEFFLPLLSGARLVIAKPKGHQDNAYLSNEIVSRRITVCHFVPSMLRLFLSHPGAGKCASLRHVFVSGEALAYDVGVLFSQTLSAGLHNLYGPTEAAVDVTYWAWEMRPDKVVPIGRAIDNIQVYILDEDLNPVPDGEAGELHIGGVGIARGYLHRPELTEASFIPDPYASDPHSRLYRSGDRARILPDGLIEYLGRMDSMVKLRGFRIELGEVEATLEKHHAVSQAVATVQDQNQDDPKLVAYVVACKAVAAKDLRDHVKGALPSYMVPNAIGFLDAVPVTRHGKIDKKALPWPIREAEAKENPTSSLASPATSSQPKVALENLLSIGHEVIGVDTITLDDDLFDQGATSFTMMRLLDRVSADFGVVVPPEVILDDPRMSAIENYINAACSADNGVIRHEDTAEDTISDLRGRVAALLGTVTIGDQDDLFDLGATSFTIVKMVDLIATEYGVTVPIDLVLDHPTLSALAAYVDANGSRKRVGDDVIALQTADIDCTASNVRTVGEAALAGPVPMQSLGRLLSLLRRVTVDTKYKYLYASAGGLNAIQTYVYVKPGGVQGIEAGVYYYNPVDNKLYSMVSGPISGFDTCFLGGDRGSISGAGFALFFIAQMNAIEAIYKDSSGVLATLECGYMGQLLLSRTASFDIDLVPVLEVQFHQICSHFNLDDGHRFIHCLVGGPQGRLLQQGAGQSAPQARVAHLREVSSKLHEHPADSHQSLSFRTLLEKSEASLALPVPQDKPGCQLAKSAIREVTAVMPAIALHEVAVDERFFDLRSAKRMFHSGAVTFKRFSGLLSLLRTQVADDALRHWYPDIAGEAGPQIYLYIKDGAVERMGAGIYRYDSIAHTLVRVATDLAIDFKSCHTPFNRKHADMASFAIFLIAPLKQLRAVSGESSIYAALLGAGYIGQLLLERQTELGMGICPIGALRFDRIRVHFNLDPADVLLHSFVCGAHDLEAPFKWPAVGYEPESPGASTAAGTGPVGEEAAEDIAIVGMAGRYPGADNLDHYWHTLSNGNTHFGLVPEARNHLYGADLVGGATQVASQRSGAFLDDIDCIDARLFSITPSEAKTIDPQERLLLEVVWECLENSGYTSEGLGENATKVGVFVGAMWDDYQHYGRTDQEGVRHRLAMSLHSSIANRVSHVFNFNGPSIALNTSCSSGMTALHTACSAIRNGDCDAAIVAAVNVIGHPYHFDMLDSLGLLSEEGLCRPFSMDGDGWVAGEGVGAVLIRPQSAALRNRDCIQAIIKGTSVAHTGRGSRFGYPNAALQQASIEAVIKSAKVPANTIHYIEAAATGAGLADAAEMSAIRAVFGGDANKPVRVGSVKGNIGHLESASAMSQLMKVVLQMHHRQLCPTVSSGRVNPLLKLHGSIVLNDELQPWDLPITQAVPGGAGTHTRRRALINAFGATGSCGHVVIEEYVQEQDPEPEPEPSQDHLILLSAATIGQLCILSSRLKDFVVRSPCTRLRLCDLAFSLMVGRVEMVERLAIVASSHDELVSKLTDFLAQKENIPGCFTARAGQVMAELDVPRMSLHDIAKAWLKGGRCQWQALVSVDARRVPLPTYPFSKSPYWIGNAVQAVDSSPNHQVAPDHQCAPVGTALQEAAQTYLKAIISQVSEVPADQIDTREMFDAIGLTSLMVHDLNARLEQDFGPLSKTLFFEHKSVGLLANYLCATHAEQVASLWGHAANSVPLVDKVSRQPKHKMERIKNPHHLKYEQVQGPIAIVGLGGRYPAANGIDTLWENLKSGADCITEIPSTRWDHTQYFDLDRTRAGTTYAKWGGFIEGYDRFDPLFFNITPKEAKEMDPQERLFLETVWQTFEDAGYSRRTLGRDIGRCIGVFVGVMYGEYDLHSPASRAPGQGLAAGSSHGSIANRISYFFDFAGPSLAIDTMCSSSLTALHLAVNSLRLGECEAAVVGGVNLSIHPNKYIRHAQAAMSSSDGRCRSFGSGGDGFVPGEGVGAVLIKPLAKAIADGDQIYGTIKGTSINHDGRTHGYTVPNPDAQAEMIADALGRCGVSADTVSYVEAHGTGTALGDPIEISGLTKAFRQHTDRVGYCAIGSIKSNIGHLEAAAGIAGLTKILLQMKHRTLVPSLHSESLNANINFEHSPFYVQRKLMHWDCPTQLVNGSVVASPRRACLSSFGAGGANAHAVIEEYAGKDTSIYDDDSDFADAMILLSAHSADRLQARAVDLLRFVQQARLSPSFSNRHLREIAYTLQVGRDPMAFRLGFVVRTMADLDEALQDIVEGGSNRKGVVSGQVRRGEGMSRFIEDEDLAYMLDAWLEKRKYHALLDLWVDGLDIDWSPLYRNNKPRRISMPVYPFAGERYWVDSPENHHLMPQNAIEIPELSGSEMMLFAPSWHAMSTVNTPLDFTAHHVYLCGFNLSTDAFCVNTPDLCITALPADQASLADMFTDVASKIFLMIKDALRTVRAERYLIQVVVPASGNGQVLAGLCGLLRTARLENPALMAQVIVLNEDDVLDQDQLVWKLQVCSQSPEMQEMRFTEGQPQGRILHAIHAPKPAKLGPWVDGGVYLLSGGAGGLSMIFAEDIGRTTCGAKLVLFGRSPLTDEQQAHLAELRSGRIRIDYHQVDVTDAHAVADLVREVLANYGHVNGVLHAAGQHCDNYILKKPLDEVVQVLKSKVNGAVNLDEATQGIDLDMFVLFSSLSGVVGNIGQADYACANGFLDAFAHFRNELVERGLRAGRTVSMGWPLWRHGGMKVDIGTQQMMRDRLGLLPMPSEAGCRALHQALTIDEGHTVVAYGEPKSVVAALVGHRREDTESTSYSQIPTAVDRVSLRDRTMESLKAVVSHVSGIAVSEIDAKEPLERYGIESVMISRMNQMLAKHFENLPQTLFFEYQVLFDLNEWLVDQYPDTCAQWCGYRVTEDQADREQTAPCPLPTPLRANIAVRSSAAVNESIAIIGMSGRYPQAATLDDLWDNLKAGRSSITEIPSDRWPLDGFFVPDRKQAVAEGLSYSKWGGFLDDFSGFDPLFFNISPREAMTMDPQERLFLQSCWAVMEDAGYTRQSIADKFDGNVGVFVGVTKTGFELYGPQLWQRGEALFPRTSFSAIANRVSYALNLRGPSMPLDTMCSSSLTAIHEACEQLRRGACEMAIAGAVNLYVHPSSYSGLCAFNMLSSDGLCKSFAQGADGFVPGEGVGAVMLKPLTTALQDGDQVHAVILGTSINHDGKTNGFTVPNPKSQGAVIRSALDYVGISARNISYLEAHGTGTALGDPIELAGLSQAFGRDTKDTDYCAIGSIKSNIGHLEAAAGLAGLTKILLQMRHRELVPSLHADVLNDRIVFEETPFRVQQTAADWPRPRVGPVGEEREVPRTAGLSSFGAGGANAHLIVQEYIPTSQHKSCSTMVDKENPVLILLSAKTLDRLMAYAADLLAFIERHAKTLELLDLAYTLQIGREPMEERLGLNAGSFEVLCRQLGAFIQGRDLAGIQYGRVTLGLEQRTAYADDWQGGKHLDIGFANGDLTALCDAWVQGMDIDWTRLYGRDKPQRITAPTYPFARDSYWFDFAETGENNPVSTLDTSGEQPRADRQQIVPEDAKTWLSLTETWQSTPVDIEATDWAERVAACKGDRLLVISEDPAYFASVRGVCDEIAQTVQDHTVSWNVRHLPLCPSSPIPFNTQQFETLMNAADAPNVIFLILKSSRVNGTGRELVKQTYAFVRSILAEAPVKFVQFYSCYREATDSDILYGEGLAGLLRSATLESVCSRYRSIALDEHSFTEDRLALRLVQEWLCDDTKALNAIQVPMIRYSSGERFELRVSETTLHSAQVSPAIFKSLATYLVVGGVGRLGVSLCCELGRRFGAQLVILSRRSQETVQADLNRIAASGATVHFRSVDILDTAELEQVLGKLKEEGVSFKGVVHLARRVQDAPIVKKSYEDFTAVAAAKVEGTMAIDAATADEPLDFFLMFSSLASFGIQGSADYAYATAFQNGFARYRNRLRDQGLRSGGTTAICWGQWDRDGGVSNDKMEARLQYMRNMGSDVIDIASALDIIPSALSRRESVIGLAAVDDTSRFLETLGLTCHDQQQLRPASTIETQIQAFESGVISKTDFSAVLNGLSDEDLTDPILDKIVTAVKRSEKQDQPECPATVFQPNQVPSEPLSPDVPPGKFRLATNDAVETCVFQSLQQVLKIRRDQIDVDKPLQDFGLDSITAMQLAANIEKELNAAVPTRWLIEYPTLKKLIQKVSEVVA